MFLGEHGESFAKMHILFELFEDFTVEVVGMQEKSI